MIFSLRSTPGTAARFSLGRLGLHARDASPTPSSYREAERESPISPADVQTWRLGSVEITARRRDTEIHLTATDHTVYPS